MNAELVPVRLGKIHVVVLRSLLDIRESERAIGFGHIDDLIESCHSVAHVLGVGERLFALIWKSKNAVRQVAARGEPSMLLVRSPGRRDVRHFSYLLLILDPDAYFSARPSVADARARSCGSVMAERSTSFVATIRP